MCPKTVDGRVKLSTHAPKTILYTMPINACLSIPTCTSIISDYLLVYDTYAEAICVQYVPTMDTSNREREG